MSYQQLLIIIYFFYLKKDKLVSREEIQQFQSIDIVEGFEEDSLSFLNNHLSKNESQSIENWLSVASLLGDEEKLRLVAWLFILINLNCCNVDHCWISVYQFYTKQLKVTTNDVILMQRIIASQLKFKNNETSSTTALECAGRITQLEIGQHEFKNKIDEFHLFINSFSIDVSQLNFRTNGALSVEAKGIFEGKLHCTIIKFHKILAAYVALI